MNRTRTLTTATLLAGLACNEGPTGTPPAGGPLTLTVTLTTPADDDGAILFTVSGGTVEAPTAASPDQELFTRVTGVNALGVVVVGDLSSGAVLEFEAPEGSDASSYTATMVQVADRGNRLRQDLSGYGLGIGS